MEKRQDDEDGVFFSFLFTRNASLSVFLKNVTAGEKGEAMQVGLLSGHPTGIADVEHKSLLQLMCHSTGRSEAAMPHRSQPFDHSRVSRGKCWTDGRATLIPR